MTLRAQPIRSIGLGLAGFGNRAKTFPNAVSEKSVNFSQKQIDRQSQLLTAAVAAYLLGILQVGTLPAIFASHANWIQTAV